MKSAAHLTNLFPVILPPDWVSDQWGGPIDPIAKGALHMTWAFQDEDRRRDYLSKEQAAAWDDEEIRWRAIALENAARLSSAGGFGEKQDEAGRPFIKTMLTDDALGPSRLFVPQLFNNELGGDYCVAVPELTLAIAFRRTLTSDQQDLVASIISGCFAHGTTRISNERFNAEDFWIA